MVEKTYLIFVFKKSVQFFFYIFVRVLSYKPIRTNLPFALIGWKLQPISLGLRYVDIYGLFIHNKLCKN